MSTKISPSPRDCRAPNIVGYLTPWESINGHSTSCGINANFQLMRWCMRMWVAFRYLTLRTRRRSWCWFFIDSIPLQQQLASLSWRFMTRDISILGIPVSSEGLPGTNSVEVDRSWKSSQYMSGIIQVMSRNSKDHVSVRPVRKI